jgi:hypothetical protein
MSCQDIGRLQWLFFHSSGAELLQKRKERGKEKREKEEKRKERREKKKRGKRRKMEI